jgi:hypothetical protein
MATLPSLTYVLCYPWIPAFAGMTDKSHSTYACDRATEGLSIS